MDNGVKRTVYWSGDVGVVTERNSKIVVTILRRSESDELDISRCY